MNLGVKIFKPLACYLDVPLLCLLPVFVFLRHLPFMKLLNVTNLFLSGICNVYYFYNSIYFVLSCRPRNFDPFPTDASRLFQGFLVIASSGHWVFTPWDTNEVGPEGGRGLLTVAPAFHECSDSSLLSLRLCFVQWLMFLQPKSTTGLPPAMKFC